MDVSLGPLRLSRLAPLPPREWGAYGSRARAAVRAFVAHPVDRPRAADSTAGGRTFHSMKDDGRGRRPQTPGRGEQRPREPPRAPSSGRAGRERRTEGVWGTAEEGGGDGQGGFGGRGRERGRRTGGFWGPTDEAEGTRDRGVWGLTDEGGGMTNTGLGARRSRGVRGRRTREGVRRTGGLGRKGGWTKVGTTESGT